MELDNLSDQDVKTQLSSDATLEQPNEWMLSIMDPRMPTSIPDLNETGTITKQITLTREFVMPAAGGIALWMPSHQEAPSVILLGKDPVSGRYNPITRLAFDLDLSQDFIRARVVSGKLVVQSNTIASGVFTVQGGIIAIGYQDLPPFTFPRLNAQQLTFETLLSYARNPSSKQTLTSIAAGVVALIHPDSDNNYMPTDNSLINVQTSNAPPTFENRTFCGTLMDTFARTTSSSAPNGSIGNGWFPGGVTAIGPGASIIIFQSSLCNTTTGPFIPANASGRIKVSGRFTAVNAIAAGQTRIQVYATLRYANPATLVETTVPIVFLVNAFATLAVSQTSYDFTAEANMNQFGGVPNVNFFWITDVTLLCTNQSAAAQIYSNEGGGTNYFRVDWLSMGEKFHQGPGSILMAEGLGAGQLLAVTGVINHQVVPNAQLARNIPTHVHCPSSLEDLLMTKFMLSQSEKLQIRFVYDLGTYEKMLAEDRFHRLASRRQMRALSAGLLGGLKGFWNNFLRPAVQFAAPVVGGLIGGPPGAMIGEGISGLLPRAESSGRRYISSPNFGGYGAQRFDSSTRRAFCMGRNKGLVQKDTVGGSTVRPSTLLSHSSSQPSQVVSNTWERRVDVNTLPPIGRDDNSNNDVPYVTTAPVNSAIKNPWDMDPEELASLCDSVLQGYLMALSSLAIRTSASMETGKYDPGMIEIMRGKILNACELGYLTKLDLSGSIYIGQSDVAAFADSVYYFSVAGLVTLKQFQTYLSNKYSPETAKCLSTRLIGRLVSTGHIRQLQSLPAAVFCHWSVNPDETDQSYIFDDVESVSFSAEEACKACSTSGNCGHCSCVEPCFVSNVCQSCGGTMRRDINTDELISQRLEAQKRKAPLASPMNSNQISSTSNVKNV